MVSPIYYDALVYSSILSLLCLGLTLTYMTTRVPNFAHASFAMIGAYVTWTMVNRDRISAVSELIHQGASPEKVFLSIRNYAIPTALYAKFILVAFIVTGTIAVLQYLLVLKPLSRRGASITGLMIATIAVDMLIFALINIYADYMQASMVGKINMLGEEYGRRLPLLVNSRDFVFYSYDKGSYAVQRAVVLAPGLVVAILGGLYLLLTRTKLGVALRASIENPDLAGVLGVNVNLVYMIAWFLSGGMAGIGGSLLPLKFFTNPSLGQILIVSIFAGSIVGGLNALHGAVLGAALVGISETIVLNQIVIHTSINAGYRPIVPLLIMVVTLLVLPQGIAGYEWRSIFGKISGKKR